MSDELYPLTESEKRESAINNDKLDLHRAKRLIDDLCHQLADAKEEARIDIDVTHNYYIGLLADKDKEIERLKGIARTFTTYSVRTNQ